MYVAVQRNEHRLLVALVKRRIRQIESALRHVRQHPRQERLQREMATLESVMHNLHEAECDVLA